MDITIHVNPAQPHQLEHAEWFKKGLKRHGIMLRITPDIKQDSDYHIVSGNHYAKDYWIGHPRTIWLDKRLYRDGEKPAGMKSDSFVSLGWLRPDGGRKFKLGENRKSPTIKERQSNHGTIFLADYCGPVEKADTVRLHPAQQNNDEPLIAALHRHRTAIGYQTTALITAALEGLNTVCKDQRSIMADPYWHQLLPYADWHYSEIESGEAWEHLCH